MKKQTIQYNEEPVDDGWKFDAKANPLDARQRRAIGLPEKNPPGPPYQRTESSGHVVVRAGGGGARPGAGRTTMGHVRLQLLIPPATRAKIEKIAARDHISLSEAVSRAVAKA
jgi:hypothetical protein